MAVLMKIFGKQRNKNNRSEVGSAQQSDAQFRPENVRLLIVKDHDLRGRDVVFDSAFENPTTKSSTAGQAAAALAAAAAGTAKHAQSWKNVNDLKLLGEMMFGSLPRCRKATTFKVHAIRSPPQLMITKVFVPSQQTNSQSTVQPGWELESFDLYSVHSLPPDTSTRPITITPRNSATSSAQSMPVNVPATCSSKGFDDSGAYDCGTPTYTSSLNISASPRAGAAPFPSLMIPLVPSTSLHTSRDRRLHKHQTTSIEHGLTHLLTDISVATSLPLAKRPTKVAVAIIFKLPQSPDNTFQNFIFSHLVLIENYVHKLKASIDEAFAAQSSEKINQAMEVFLYSMRSLYMAPRLPNPVWLAITHSSSHVSLGTDFLKDFMLIIDKHNTKNTKFFVSNLLTAVLTHHLSWVATVSPAGDTPTKSYLNKRMPSWLHSLARSHPYNPLWAQLGDLCGAIGFPLRMSRTVVIGTNTQLVVKLLRILSYFIRCSDILEATDTFPDLDDIQSQETQQLPSSSVSHDENLTVFSSLSSNVPCLGPVLSRSCSNVESSCGTGDVMQVGTPPTGQCQNNSAETLASNSELAHEYSIVLKGSEAMGSEHKNLMTLGVETLELTEPKKCHEQQPSDLMIFDDLQGKTKSSVSQTKIVSVTSLISASQESKGPCRLARDNFSEPRIETVTHARSAAELRLSSKNFEVASSTLIKLDAGCHKSSGHSGIQPLAMDHDRTTTCSPVLPNVEVSHEINVQPRTATPAVDTDGTITISSSTSAPVNLVIDTNTRKSSNIYPDLHLELERCSYPSASNPADLIRPAQAHTVLAEVARDSGVWSLEPLSILNIQSEGDRRSSDSDSKSQKSNSSIRIRLSTDGKEYIIENDSLSVDGCTPGLVRRGTSMFDDLYDDHNPTILNIDSSFQGSNGLYPSHLLEPETLMHVNHCGTDENMLESMTNCKTLPEVLDQGGEGKDAVLRPCERQDSMCDGVSLCASVMSDEHFSSGNTLLGGDPLDHLPASHSTDYVRSAISLMKDVVSERHRRPSSRQSQHGTTRCRTGRELSVKKPSFAFVCDSTESLTPSDMGGHGPRSTSASSSLHEDQPATAFTNFVDIPLKASESLAESNSTSHLSHDYNFGRSLLAGCCDHYMSDFVLHGTKEKAILSSPYAAIHRDLSASVQNSVLDEPIAEASCIIADIDKWSVQLFSCKYNSPDELKVQPLTSSQLVCNIIESVHDLWKLKMSPEFCLVHLEDHLQGIYLKSKILAEYIKVHRRLYSQELAVLHGFDMSDMPLLIAVAGTHSPDIFQDLFSLTHTGIDHNDNSRHMST